MNDCWKRLGLEPTADLAAIKRAYREQVKRYHPDTVATPEQKRRYTIICAAINDAYREAVRQARAANATPPADEPDSFTDDSYPDDNASATAQTETAQSEFDDAPTGRQPSAATSLLRSPASLRTALLIFLGFEVAIFFVGQVRVPASVQTVAGIFIALFIGFFVYGLLTAGAMDLLIFWLFPRGLLDRLGLAKYESKLIWLTILVANGAVFFFTDLIARPSHHDIATTILDITVRAAATVTVPLIVMALWLRDLLRYRRIEPDDATT